MSEENHTALSNPSLNLEAIFPACTVSLGLTRETCPAAIGGEHGTEARRRHAWVITAFGQEMPVE